MTLIGHDGDDEVVLECGCRVDVTFAYEWSGCCEETAAQYLRHTGGKLAMACDRHGWHTTPEAYAQREQAAFEAKRGAERAQFIAESKLGNYESALARIAYLESTIADMRHLLKAANGRMHGES
jgi:hypothetical protein